MRKIFLLLILSAISFQGYTFQIELETDETLLIFVRHAERAEDGTRNPPISFEGRERANNLAKVISSDELPLSLIYSTDYKRTEMTALPTSFKYELDIIEYGFDDIENWLSSVIENNNGKAILIVGHSNTTPRLINIVLGEERLEQLDEHDYGDLFLLTTSELGTGNLVIKDF